MLYSGKDLRKLIIPLIIEQILAIAVGMADTIMVSAAGEAAVSGVSLVDTVNILLINVFSALATGGAVVSGHFLGKKKREDACKSAWQILLFATLLAFVISVIFITAHDPLLRLMFGKIEDDVMKASKTYLIITTYSFVALAIYNSCAALFRAMNESKVTMWVSLLMNVINVVGNAICIYGLHMGVAGVAIPTTISRYVAAVVIFLLMFQTKKEINLCGQITWKFNGSLIKKILYIAIPNGLENSMFQLGKILVMSAVATMGTSAIAANAVTGTIANWNNLPGFAINLAIVSVVSVCVGAGRYDQARYYTRRLCRDAMIGIGCLSIILYLSSDTGNLFQSRTGCSSADDSDCTDPCGCKCISLDAGVWRSEYTEGSRRCSLADECCYFFHVGISSRAGIRIHLCLSLWPGFHLGGDVYRLGCAGNLLCAPI